MILGQRRAGVQAGSTHLERFPWPPDDEPPFRQTSMFTERQVQVAGAGVGPLTFQEAELSNCRFGGINLADMQRAQARKAARRAERREQQEPTAEPPSAPPPAEEPSAPSDPPSTQGHETGS